MFMIPSAQNTGNLVSGVVDLMGFLRNALRLQLGLLTLMVAFCLMGFCFLITKK
jgi:hypothetical protein